MRSLLTALAILAFTTVGGCAESSTRTASVPMCKYWSDSGWGDNADPSQQPMLPNNPYWVKHVPANSPEIAASAKDPCAGEPGHMLYLPG